LVLAGDGPKRAELEAQVKALGIGEHVELRGKVAPDDVSPLLHSLGGFVLASRTEGLPVALVEALAHGKPIVSSEAGGIPELLGNSKAALLVPIGDPMALALAVMRVTTDDALREQMVRAARDEFRTSRYHEQAVFHDMLRHYRAARAAT
jgi:glycosyltransferase involved in cell wall biosynthesis